jgi:hypothetical protein
VNSLFILLSTERRTSTKFVVERTANRFILF